MLGRILVFIGGLLVLILFAALFVPYFVDWSDFRKEFESQASRAIGKKVEVVGNVEVRFLPFPSVTMHDVRVGRDINGQPLATAQAFSMDAELAPILGGEVRVFKMELDQPVLNLSLENNGSLAWHRTGDAALSSQRIVFENVEVRNGEIRLSDEKAGRVHKLSNINAVLSAEAIEGPWRMEGRGILDGHAGGFTIKAGRPDIAAKSMRVHLTVAPEEWFATAALEGDLTLVDGRPAYTGDFRWQIEDATNDDNGSKSTSSPPRISGDFELTSETLKVPEYRLEIGSRIDPYVITGEGNFDTRAGGSFLLTANGQQFNVERLSSYTANTKKGRVSSSNARQRLDVLIAFLRRLSVPQMPGKVTFRLPALVAGDTTIRSVVLDARPDGNGWLIDSSSAELPGRTQVEASGRLSLGDGAETAFSGSLLVASRQPTGLSQWLTGKVSSDVRNLSRAGFSADVILQRGEQTFDNLQVIAGNGVLNGSLARHTDVINTPSINVDLSGNIVDFQSIKALVRLVVGEDLDDGLNAHNIQAKFKAETLNVFDLTANNVDAKFNYNSGVLSVDRLSVGDIVGTQLTLAGQAQMRNADKPSGSARLTLSSEDISKLVITLKKRGLNYPLFSMIAENALWYQQANIGADFTFGQEDAGASAVFRGSVNGSKIAGSWRADSLDERGDMSIQLQASNPDTGVLFGQVGLSPLPIPAPAGGQLSLSVEQSGADNPASITVRANSGDTQFVASGKGGLGAADFLNGEYSISLVSPDLEPYLAINAFAVPGTAFGVPVSLKATLDIDKDRYALSAIDGTVDTNELSGQLALKRGQPVARLNGALSLDRLDLAWLMETIFGPNFTMYESELSDVPFMSGYFGTAEADIDLQAGTFENGLWEPVTGMSGRVVFRGGGLSVQDLTGHWLGGTLSGGMRLGNANGNGYFQSQFSVSDGVLPTDVWMSNGESVVSGQFDLEGVVETTADTALGLLSRASGSGVFTLKDPVIAGVDFSVAEPLLEWADTQGTEVANDAMDTEMRTLLFSGTSFETGDIAIPFSIADGALQARNVFLDLPEVQLYGAMRTDLSTLKMNATLEAALKLGPGNEDGASAGFDLIFAGDFSKPTYKLDLSETKNFLALRAVERERARVERLQAVLLEKQRLRREALLYSSRDKKRQLDRALREDAKRLRLKEDQRNKTNMVNVEASPLRDWDSLIDSFLGGAQEARDQILQ